MQMRAANILGSTRCPALLTPMISSASICSVTRIVPSWDAMLEPTLPAKITGINVGLNSRIMV